MFTKPFLQPGNCETAEKLLTAYYTSFLLEMKYLLVVLLLQLFGLVFANEYSKDPHVFELNSRNFHKVIDNSNYTTIVKFYAPWCGYCKQLAPIYHKLGKLIHKEHQYAVNVAAVNCDILENKQLCAQYRVQGFPTLMVFRPAKYTGNPSTSKHHASEVYSGERSLKKMSQFLTSRLKNYVTKFHNVNDKLQTWWSEEHDIPRVLLISSNLQVGPLLKSLAIDFLAKLDIGMVTAKKAPVTLNNQELTGDLPMLVYYDNTTQTLLKYDYTDKLNDKTKITQWIMDVTNVKPQEGPLSAKEERVSKYRTGKKVKKQKKQKKQEKDEL